MAYIILVHNIFASNALVHPTRHGIARQKPTAPRNPTKSAIYAKNNASVNNDLLKTLELKDEALLQAQSAVGSLETALNSAVSNLENMQQQLQLRVNDLERELESTKRELGSANNELGNTKSELVQSQRALENAESRIEQLEASLAVYEGENISETPARKKSEVRDFFSVV